MSRHSLIRESLIPSSSLLRRKSVLSLAASDTSLCQNDDDAERLERRRTAEIEMRQRDNTTPPSHDKRKSVGGSIAGLSPTQLADHYANCIKLSAENKINTKNAFSLQLIDYMAMMLKKRDSKMDNFQVASCTLDASTKIYAYRVDSVHIDVLKMAGGLAAGYRKRNLDNEGEEEKRDGEGDCNEEEASSILRKRKNRKPKNTIVNNIESLNAKPDLDYTMDPLFLQSTGNMGDCQPGECHFLTSLKIYSNYSLTLSSDLPYCNAEDGNGSSKGYNEVPLPPIPDLQEKAICPTFSQFHFTSWSLATEDQNGGSPQIYSMSHDMDNDYAFDMNAVPEPVPVCESNVQVDNFEVPGIDEDIDSDGEEAPAVCAAAQKNSAPRIVDMRKHLSSSPREYSYFKAGALDLWAGPSHWKIKPSRHGNLECDGNGESGNYRKRKRSNKKEISICFQLKQDLSMVAIELNRGTLKLAERTVTKVWSAQKNTYPPDMHYDCKKFEQLQIRKSVGVSTDPVSVEDTEFPQVLPADNDNDGAENCPNIDFADDPDDADDDDLVGQHQDVHTNFTMEGMATSEAFFGDNLVAPPNKVARLFIPYAQRAKKMDMKKLKAAIWSILVNAEKHQEITDIENLRIEKQVNFSHLYDKLPSYLSSTLSENLSPSLVLVAVLHLANEKNLNIVGNENLNDLVISQD